VRPTPLPSSCRGQDLRGRVACHGNGGVWCRAWCAKVTPRSVLPPLRSGPVFLTAFVNRVLGLGRTNEFVRRSARVTVLRGDPDMRGAQRDDRVRDRIIALRSGLTPNRVPDSRPSPRTAHQPQHHRNMTPPPRAHRSTRRGTPRRVRGTRRPGGGDPDAPRQDDHGWCPPHDDRDDAESNPTPRRPGAGRDPVSRPVDWSPVTGRGSRPTPG